MNDALLTPRKALGRYEILGEIARGAMGVVYKARDPLIDRLVAIKTVMLGPSDAETEAFERRFFREAKSAGRLNHPNVVIIHDVGKTDDIAYIAMEFLDGRSLREILDSGVVLPPQRIADISSEIAEGLAFAHRNQVIHRDVKPANIMVLASGAVKITDFGIALLPTGTRTLSTNAFGSPRYTSPEQVMGRTIDGRSDIFSLGAVVYEMLTGRSPFAGGDLNSILRQVLSDPTPPPSSHNPKLPRAFDHIVGKALAKDPADRYQNAQEMADDLRHFDSIEFETAAPAPLPALEHATSPLDSLPPEVDADPPLDVAGVISTTPAWWKERRVMIAAAASVAVIAIIAGITGVATRKPSQTAPMVAETARGATAGAIASAPVAVPAPTPVNAKPAAPAPALAEPAAPQTGAPAIAAVPAAIAAAADKSTTAPVTSPAAPKPTGRVVIAVTPWGEVIVDGRKRGLTPPLTELRLAPGSHVIEIRNSTFAPYRETIDVIADGSVRIKHKFE